MLTGLVRSHTTAVEEAEGGGGASLKPIPEQALCVLVGISVELQKLGLATVALRQLAVWR